MEFFFPEDQLDRKPPEETIITSLRVNPSLEGNRLRIDLEMTPFQKRPHLEISVTNAAGDEVAAASIIEPMNWKLEFTMHIRGELRNPHSLEARLYYPDGPSQEPIKIPFEFEPPTPQDG